MLLKKHLSFNTVFDDAIEVFKCKDFKVLRISEWVIKQVSDIEI